MDTAKYTPVYQEHLTKMERAQVDFDKKPCKQTATVLSDLRETQFTDEQKFTAEYIDEMRHNRASFMERIGRYVRTANVADALDSGRISEGVAARLLAEADAQGQGYEKGKIYIKQF